MGPITTADLAEWIGGTISSTRSACKRLERRGLIEPQTYQRASVAWMTSDAYEDLMEAKRQTRRQAARKQMNA